MKVGSWAVVMALILMLSEAQAPSVLVGGWDNRPTATVAEGLGVQLAPIKVAVEKCGFSRTWVWDDDSDGAQLWVLASEVRPTRLSCLRRWRAKAVKLNVKWQLVGL